MTSVLAGVRSRDSLDNQALVTDNYARTHIVPERGTLQEQSWLERLSTSHSKGRRERGGSWVFVRNVREIVIFRNDFQRLFSEKMGLFLIFWVKIR